MSLLPLITMLRGRLCSCCNIILCFFGLIHRPSLHFFPTRRSSDLLNAAYKSNLPRVNALKFARIACLWNSSALDRKSTRLNSSHVASSYAVFCLQKNQFLYTHSYTEFGLELK